MKFSVSVALMMCTALTSAIAQAYSVNELLQEINSDRLTTIEQVIAKLPLEMRENYILQYHGGGVQSASYQKPRAILFGKDARIVITFNSDPSQKMGNSFEILEFNDDKKFELFVLDFPLKSRGRPIRREDLHRNPPQCLQCHAAGPKGDPFPIWGRYPFWKGSYGANEDLLLGNEVAEFTRFQKKWADHPRYRHLSHGEGKGDSAGGVSPVSPYSTDAFQTLSYRPNNNLGQYLARLNAQALAETIKKRQGFEKYVLLASPSAFHCMKGADADIKNALNRALRAEMRVQGITRPADPAVPLYDTANVTPLLGSSPYAWGMLSAGLLQTNGSIAPQTRLLDPYFLDGEFMTTPNYVLGELSEPLFRKYGALAPHYQPSPVAPQVTGNPRVVKTDRDREIAAQIDSLGIPLGLVQPDCSTFFDLIKKEFKI